MLSSACQYGGRLWALFPFLREWFSLLGRRILRYGDFRPPDELPAAIVAFIREWNETEAHPFRWTYEGLPLLMASSTSLFTGGKKA